MNSLFEQQGRLDRVGLGGFVIPIDGEAHSGLQAVDYAWEELFAPRECLIDFSHGPGVFLRPHGGPGIAATPGLVAG